VSSAFFLQVGGEGVLLGADVESNSKANSGWNGVLNSSTLPVSKAQLVKIPHHGGLSGHHDGMWSELAVPRPIATLTPWAKAGGKLPSAADVERLKRIVGTGFSTGPSALGKETNQPTVVAKVLAKDRIKLRRIAELVGHVRHRATVSGGPLVWHTDLFGRGCALEAMAA
jgi:hypothetical protein